MQQTFEITGIFYKSLLDQKYPCFILKHPNDRQDSYLHLYTTDKSKPFAEKISPGEEVKITFTITSREKNGFWNTYNNALKVEKVKAGNMVDKVKETLDLHPTDLDESGSLPF